MSFCKRHFIFSIGLDQYQKDELETALDTTDLSVFTISHHHSFLTIVFYKRQAEKSFLEQDYNTVAYICIYKDRGI